MHHILILFGITVLSLISWRYARFYYSRSKLPQGPKGIPIFGNAFQVPQKMPWLRFSEWAEQFGPIYSLDMAGQPLVIVNTFKMASDLLEHRSALYSDRPRFIMAGEILTGGIFMVFAQYGNVWRRMRKAGHEEFSVRASMRYQPLQQRNALINVANFLSEPKTWIVHMKRSTAATILGAVYGWRRITPEEEGIIARIHRHTQHIASAVVPGAFLVEIFPLMKTLPMWMSKWKRDGLSWHARETEMFEGLIDGVRDKMDTAASVHCFVRSLLSHETQYNLSKKESAWLAGIMFSAGAETTLATLLNAVMGFILYPETQARAQEELDAVVGRERLPSFADKDRLPFINAIVREVLRWRPVGPVAVPRRLTQGDEYLGYRLPKGAIVIPNVWAMNHDPSLFPDYDDFRPDRFLPESIAGNPALSACITETHGLGHGTFGFGRRVCVGANFANQTLFIQIATMLWACRFSPALDQNGNEIYPDKHSCIDAGVVVLPAPFECEINERFEGAMAIIRSFLDNQADDAVL